MLPQQDRPIRILMIDDHAVLRAGLRMIIESHIGMVVVGEAENRRDLLAAIANETPDIILLDLDLGDENGLDLLPELTRRRARCADHLAHRIARPRSTTPRHSAGSNGPGEQAESGRYRHPSDREGLCRRGLA